LKNHLLRLRADAGNFFLETGLPKFHPELSRNGAVEIGFPGYGALVAFRQHPIHFMLH